MFCTKCGNRITAQGARFCESCGAELIGASIPPPKHAYDIRNSSTGVSDRRESKTNNFAMRMILFVCFLIVIVFVTFFLFYDGRFETLPFGRSSNHIDTNELFGLWMRTTPIELSEGVTTPPSLWFSGNSFRLIEYGSRPVNRPDIRPVLRSGLHHSLDERESNVVGWRVVFRYTSHGTFSLMEDSIRLVYTDGHVSVHSFSLTNDTMTINGIVYERQLPEFIITPAVPND